MAHWPTIAATTTLAAFVVAGALIHVGGAVSVVGVSGEQSWTASPDARGPVKPVGDHPPTVTAQTNEPQGAAAARYAARAAHGPASTPQALKDPMAHGPAMADAAGRAAAVSGHEHTKRDTSWLAGEEMQVAAVAPPVPAYHGPRPQGTISVVPLPPIPPQPPARPERPLPGPAPQGLQPGSATGVDAALAASVQARMAVAMPLSIPELGPLDPARISGAARELAEAVHVLASQTSPRTLASGAGASRKAPDGCLNGTQARPALVPAERCQNAGL